MLQVKKRMKVGEEAVNQNSYSHNTKRFQQIATEALYTENCAAPMAGYITFLEGVKKGFDEIEPYVAWAKRRILVLQEYHDIYCDGKDIIMAKLSGDAEDVSPDPSSS